MLVPSRPDDPASDANRKAWKSLAQFKKPFLTLFSDGDPITKGGEKILQKMIPGTQESPHITITEAGHFLQEDKGKEIAELMISFIRMEPWTSAEFPKELLKSTFIGY